VTAILIDTNAYAAFKRGLPEAVSVVQQVPSIAFNAVVLGELMGGFAAGAKEQQNRAELDAFLASPRVRVVTMDRGTGQHYAAVYAALRKTGLPIPTNDMWIAASAIQHGLRLFTFDDHFRHLPGLGVARSPSELARP
jgi:tRNA(fMet)-specific endonuclease VapC